MSALRPSMAHTAKANHLRVAVNFASHYYSLLISSPEELLVSYIPTATLKHPDGSASGISSIKNFLHNVPRGNQRVAITAVDLSPHSAADHGGFSFVVKGKMMWPSGEVEYAFTHAFTLKNHSEPTTFGILHDELTKDADEPPAAAAPAAVAATQQPQKTSWSDETPPMFAQPTPTEPIPPIAVPPAAVTADAATAMRAADHVLRESPAKADAGPKKTTTAATHHRATPVVPIVAPQAAQVEEEPPTPASPPASPATGVTAEATAVAPAAAPATTMVATAPAAPAAVAKAEEPAAAPVDTKTLSFAERMRLKGQGSAKPAEAPKTSTHAAAAEPTKVTPAAHAKPAAHAEPATGAPATRKAEPQPARPAKVPTPPPAAVAVEPAAVAVAPAVTPAATPAVVAEAATPAETVAAPAEPPVAKPKPANAWAQGTLKITPGAATGSSTPTVVVAPAKVKAVESTAAARTPPAVAPAPVATPVAVVAATAAPADKGPRPVAHYHLFVKGLPEGTGEQDIVDLLSPHIPVKRPVKIDTKRVTETVDGASVEKVRTFAFVLLDCAEADISKNVRKLASKALKIRGQAVFADEVREKSAYAKR